MTRPRHADYDLDPHLELALRPVAVMRSPFREHLGTPRQPGVGERRDGAVVVRHGLQNLLAHLGGFSHLWLVFWCNYARGWNHQVVPPRDTERRGLFATRSPHRPNPLGISVVPLLAIEKRVLHVGPHDLLDGTPILDIKPYLAYCDAVPDAREGWVAELGEGAGPDHRDWRSAEG